MNEQALKAAIAALHAWDEVLGWAKFNAILADAIKGRLSQ
jgi:hypothetical protein